jgi:hypothetical protein
LFSTEGITMSEDRAVIGKSELWWWLLVAALVVVGVSLYFIYAPDSRPVATPTVQETP